MRHKYRHTHTWLKECDDKTACKPDCTCLCAPTYCSRAPLQPSPSSQTPAPHLSTPPIKPHPGSPSRQADCTPAADQPYRLLPAAHLSNPPPGHPLPPTHPGSPSPQVCPPPPHCGCVSPCAGQQPAACAGAAHAARISQQPVCVGGGGAFGCLQGRGGDGRDVAKSGQHVARCS